MIPEVAAIIAGERHTTARWYDTVDPTTERVIARVADCRAEDADAAVRQAAEAAPKWAMLAVERRRAALGIAAERLAARREELIGLAVSDTGARREVAAQTQVGAAIDRLLMWSAMGEDALHLPSPAVRDGLTSEVRRVPVGVVACISPYNFPLLAMVGKVAPALFAGNAVVLKPAPQDPLLVVALAEALRDGLAEVGAPAGTLSLLTGADAELGAALVRDDRVGAVSFTGSTEVGIRIHREAAPTMKRLLLELGGKGALIVRPDADLAVVVESLARTWTVQSGQVCLTPARLIADDAVHDELVGRLLGVLGSLRLGDPRDLATTVGPVISAEQRRRVTALVAGARDEGCTVAQHPDVPEVGFFVPPALVTGCEPDSTIMQEEVFGPVLSVARTRGDDEAVAVANNSRYGLYDYVFSADTDRARAIAGRLRSAQVGVNTVRRHPGAPFGGNRASGIGRSGGTYGLDAYTNVQAHTLLERSDARTTVQERGQHDA